MANSIGKMRYRVKVENATNTRDAGGGLSQSFSPVTYIYANIKPTNAVIPNEANNIIISSPPEAFTFLLLMANCRLFLSKLICEFLFTSQILPAIANQDKIIIPVAKAIAVPPARTAKNKTLNKLSLFNLALMKLRIVASFCVLHKYTLSPIVAKKQLYIQYSSQYYFLYSINIVNMLYLRYYIRMSILLGTKL